MLGTKREGNSVRLFSISINLLLFYHDWRSLIGYPTHYLFLDSSQAVGDC